MKMIHEIDSWNRFMKIIHENDSWGWFVKSIHEIDSWSWLVKLVHENDSWSRLLSWLIKLTNEVHESTSAVDSWIWSYYEIDSLIKLINIQEHVMKKCIQEIFVNKLHKESAFMNYFKTVFNDSWMMILYSR